MYFAYKYRIYPSERQKNLLSQTFGACRFVYNWGLNFIKETREKKKRYVSQSELFQAFSKQILPSYSWLSGVDRDILYQELYILQTAFTKYRKEANRYPKMKRRDSGQSFRCKKDFSIDESDCTLFIPAIGWIDLEQRFEIDGDVRFVTIEKTQTNEYFAAFNVNRDIILPSRKKIERATTIGIDLGIHTLAVCSDGRSYENKGFMHDSQVKIGRLNEKLKRMESGSQNYIDMILKIRKEEEKVRNRRKDWFEKVTYELTHDENIKTICVETLDVKEMMTDYKMKEMLYDASIFSFRKMLEWKCKLNGINFISISRYDPSSKTCNKCGGINNNLTLRDRKWTCPHCGAHLDRDYNAACNIRDMGLLKYGVP